MQNAKCLITDNSGIAIEFVLLFKRPVLYFEGNDKIQNVEFNKYNDLIMMDQKVKDSFGFTFKKENIEDIDVMINKSTSEFVNKDDQIKDFIVNNFYNYGDTVDNFKDLITKDFLNNIN